MTSLQNRGLVNSLMASPFILNTFIAAYITDGISAFTENGVSRLSMANGPCPPPCPLPRGAPQY